MSNNLKPDVESYLIFDKDALLYQGSFVFPVVPSGDYSLVPFYKGDLTHFEETIYHND